jgi:hypothetical protein
VEFDEPAKEKLVAYEKRWMDDDGNQTGAARFWGPPMIGGDAMLEKGLQIWYKCEAHQDWFIVPCGWVALVEGVEADLFRN